MFPPRALGSIARASISTGGELDPPWSRFVEIQRLTADRAIEAAVSTRIKRRTRFNVLDR